MLTTWSPSLAEALVAVAAGQTRAVELDLAVAVAVVNGSGILLALQSMDGTQPAGPEVAVAKARAAALFWRPTASFEQVAQALDRPSILLLPAAVGRALPVEGGLPITVADRSVIGAVGVSGGSGEQDADIAAHAVTALLLTAGVAAPPAPLTNRPGPANRPAQENRPAATSDPRGF